MSVFPFYKQLDSMDCRPSLETGDKFSYFCVDEANNRIIAYFEGREEALGYFNIPVKY